MDRTFVRLALRVQSYSRFWGAIEQPITFLSITLPFGFGYAFLAFTLFTGQL
jgi:hypothetical protein